MEESLNKVKRFLNNLGEKIYKYRYLIGILIILICTFLELSGSSIGCWDIFVNSGIKDKTILGTPRSIRSDEWAVLTPMTFSQKFSGFKWFSNLLRGNKTDVFMVYGLPTLNLMQIFRPFQLGYLFLGNSRGLSFFWFSRLVFLFLISFELGMILSKKNKLLSLLMAILVTFSPMVQWWFAVNGMAEILIFGELALVSLYYYINAKSLSKRIIWLFLIVLSAGGYLLILYPAWQVPMIYVIAFLGIAIIIENRKNIKLNYKDIISIVLALVIFASCMLYIFNNSADTIKTIMNTDYPGSRTYLGGGEKGRFAKYLPNIFLTYKEYGLNTNTSEEAVMFSLFPIGLILAITAMIKNKKADIITLLLLIPYAFIGIYCAFGLPEIIAKITLMGYSLPIRAFMAVGFIDIVILIRGLTLTEKPFKIWSAILVSLIVSIIMVCFAKKFNPNYVSAKIFIALLIISIYLFFFTLIYKTKFGKVFLLLGITAIMFQSGVRVNPLRQGISIIYDSPIIKEIQSINNSRNGTWIVEGIGFPMPNYVLMAGVPVINSTNVYPDLEKWEKIDTENKYKYFYNRYAHIRIDLLHENDECSEKFTLVGEDQFTVYVYPEELRTLSVDYILTARFLDEYNTEKINFEFIDIVKGYTIYRVNYK